MSQPKPVKSQSSSYCQTETEVGMTAKSFYSSKPKGDAKMKRKLAVACQSVKVKRTQDLILSNVFESKPHLSEFQNEEVQPPLIYRVFAKQSDALIFSENFPQCSNVFAFETDMSGKRHFVSCHPVTLWTLLKAKSAEDRHAYEVIGMGMHSKVFFDKFKK